MPSCLVFALALMLQGNPSTPPADAMAFLTKVTQRYADAKSYHIEATLERTSSNALSRHWNKYVYTAIVAPGGRYRYEGRSGSGSAALVSDGTKEWIYHPDVREYTETAVVVGKLPEYHVYRQEEIAAMEAQGLIGQIRMLATPLKSATFLPDENINLNGRTVDCRVVHADFEFRPPIGKTDETVWIDKAQDLIVKTVTHSESFTFIPDENFKIPTKMEETTVYTLVQLNSAEPESSFTFAPPSDAKLMASFPTPDFGVTWPASDFVGKSAPEVRLKLAGKDLPLSSFRGKPVLLDFWATWCGPCVAAMPDLKKLYAETHDKGLVWVGIDEDKDPAKMDAYLKENEIPWANDNDADGSLGEAFGPHGIPLEVLIDPSGKVTLWKMGYDDANLRAAIAKLGPEFSAVAMKSAEANTPTPKP